MTNIKCFEDTEVWQTARRLAQRVYSLTNRRPFSRDFGLVEQTRRASVSIMSNIAEGFESQTDKTFMRFLGIAKASAGELRSQLCVALDQKYISEGEFKFMGELCRSVSRQVSGFKQYLERSNSANSRP